MMTNSEDEKDVFVKKTIGEVIKYTAAKGFGFIRVAGIYSDVFVSHRHIIQEEGGTKKLFDKDHVSLDLFKTTRGYAAKNVKVLNQDEYFQLKVSENQL